MSNEITLPRVSVIIPNYQHARFLEERIQSVLGQSFQDFEVILLDDASTDGSVGVIERYRTHPKVLHIIFNESNTGKPFLQWKRGMELARGSLVWIAESDDVAKPEFLANMVQAFDRYPNLVLATAILEFIDEEGQPLGLVEEDLYGTYDGMDILAEKLGHRNCIRNASAVVFDKQVGMTYIDEVVGYRYSGDWLFWALMAMHPGGCMHFNPFRLCLYRLHGSSVYGQVRGYRRAAPAMEQIRVLCDINLRPEAIYTSVTNIHKFILLNNDLWFWIYAVPSNVGLILRFFLRSGYWHLLVFLSMTLAWDLLVKLRNKTSRFLSLWGSIRKIKKAPVVIK